MRLETNYDAVRSKMRSGDGLLFGGKGLIPSGVIRYWTRPYFWKPWHLAVGSHWATVLDVEEPAHRVRLIESTTLNGKSGVQINYASERIAGYDGSVYYLPLSRAVRERMDHADFTRWCLEQEGKSYDKVLIAHLFLDRFNLFSSRESWNSFDCSEIGSGAAKVSGMLPANINSSEVTPQKMCEFRIWAPHYYQLKGKAREIDKFNTLSLH